MLFFIHTVSRILVSLCACVAVLGHSYDEDYSLTARDYYEGDGMLSSRELGLNNVGYLAARGYADGDDFTLTSRDLARLGVRADDISHVLVIRTQLTAQDIANLKAQKKKHQEGLKGAKATLATNKENLKTAKAAKPKDEAKIKHWSERVQQALDMVKYNQEEIESCDNLLAGH